MDVSMKDYGSVLMVASGFGIVAHLPYLKALLEGYMASRVVTRRIHLVWQVNHPGESTARSSSAFPSID